MINTSNDGMYHLASIKPKLDQPNLPLIKFGSKNNTLPANFMFSAPLFKFEDKNRTLPSSFLVQKTMNPKQKLTSTTFNRLMSRHSSSYKKLNNQELDFQEPDFLDFIVKEDEKTRLLEKKEKSYASQIQKKIKKFLPKCKNLKSGLQRSKNAIEKFLFFKNDQANSSKKAFRFFMKGAIQTGVAMKPFSTKKAKITIEGSHNQQVKDHQIGKKLAFQVASRSLMLVATPLQILKDIALIPLGIQKSIYLANLKKNIHLIKEINLLNNHSLSPITNTKIYTKVSAMALKNIGFTLISPLRSAFIGSALLVAGVNAMTSRKNPIFIMSKKMVACDLNKDNIENAQNKLNSLKNSV